MGAIFQNSNSISIELERIASNFIWNGKMHVWSWKSTCLPKREGGLGLREVQDISLAAGIKMIWILFTTNSLWARRMHHHYVKGSPISQLQFTILDLVLGSLLCIAKSGLLPT